MHNEIWILTEEYNDYDQHGAYFIEAWDHKPTREELEKYLSFHKDTLKNHINSQFDWLLSGGGRQKDEYTWYNLERHK